MESSIAKQLVDKIYEKRKAAALDLEKQIRECQQQNDHRRISQIIDQLVEMFSNTSNALHMRNGGLIGLAGTAIALGVDVAPYMEKFVHPLLDCFVDTENRIRYFSAECLYNIAKVSKGEVLVYFNEIFDALSKLAADSELSVKNGAELLDRLLKDIVAESASVYIPLYPETERARDEAHGVLVPYPDGVLRGNEEGLRKAFSLAHFVPLLRDRIYVVSPFTRSYLVSWINVLDSVPELEFIAYLPEFLDGLLKYLSDPTEDVRVATETLLADFVREIRDVTVVRKRTEEKAKSLHDSSSIRHSESGVDESRLPDFSVDQSERAVFIAENDGSSAYGDDIAPLRDDGPSEVEYRDTGAWIPGQGVRIDYDAIIEILIQQLDGEHDEIQQSTALRWLAEFLTFTSEVMVPFTPRLIPAILPNLAHHVTMIQSAALQTNKLLLNVIQALPSPSDPAPRPTATAVPRLPGSPTPTGTSSPSKQSSVDVDLPADHPTIVPVRSRTNLSGVDQPRLSDMGPPPLPNAGTTSRPHSPVSFTSQTGQNSINIPYAASPEEADPFDYQATVNELTIQFLSEFEETRVAALKWLIMLHQKAPRKILAMDDGTFPALLKTLSDSSEEVIKHDLQLLAQISSSSEETYFKAFMMNLLELFSTDRRLLETRGSLIIRQLCLNLNTERIYRTFAEILEKEEDLEFASVIVQKLNLILITSPELSDFRKRLKSLETRQDGQALFTTLYRSWCHNAVSVFSLCLLAQAYEHASNLLSILSVVRVVFQSPATDTVRSADLEITVPMLVQVDKLVQLIESPVFTCKCSTEEGCIQSDTFVDIRLQLLEPERYPYLFKCLYGLLMLLPQSSAFVSLRNRLNAVNSAGFLHIAPKSTMSAIASRSKIGGRDEIKWQELLLHFRSVQSRHEKARRQAMGADTSMFSSTLSDSEKTDREERVGRSTSARPGTRRRVTGEIGSSPMPGPGPGPGSAPTTRGPGALSPLNPRARGSIVGSGILSPQSQSSMLSQQSQKPRRAPIGLGRKT
ncbi:unnamed protein product [Mycena citricolor]|uniref:Vacuolar protein 14 C-terminal Fig4-binding domain-containing protein n=1 Tax=Mycena citricolor TaxID=2018698 RepID=A0AAD2K3H1_9AGAR|nr:unnamed protein product [Mycena citricolor]